MAHGELGPSKSHRFLVCTGSLMFNSDGPESIYAEDGSLGHAILALTLKGHPVLTGDPIQVGNKSYTAPAIRIQQSIEVRDFVNQWKQAHPDFVVESEVPLQVTAGIGLKIPLFDGTADVIAYNIEEAVVLDAKFGFVRVEPKGNSQLYLYAIGLLYEILKNFGEVPKFVTVIIAQPNYEGVMDFREHRMESTELFTWMTTHQEAITHAYDVIAGNAKPKFDASSEYACRYCPGRNQCSTRTDKLREFALDEWRMTHTLTEMLPLLPQLKNIIADLEREAVTQLAKGMPVPGYKLVESNSIRKWVSEDDVLKVADEKSLSVMAKPKIMSPAQVEKTYGAKGKELTAAMAYKPKGGPKLTVESDPRPPYASKPFTQEEIDEMLRGE